MRPGGSGPKPLRGSATAKDNKPAPYGPARTKRRIKMTKESLFYVFSAGRKAKRLALENFREIACLDEDRFTAIADDDHACEYIIETYREYDERTARKLIEELKTTIWEDWKIF
jgi:hypothetical protein